MDYRGYLPFWPFPAPFFGLPVGVQTYAELKEATGSERKRMTFHEAPLNLRCGVTAVVPCGAPLAARS